MNIVTGTFFDTLPVPAKLVIMALILIILLALVIWITRRVLSKNSQSDDQGIPARLAVVDVANVDGHRRMVLVRRDNVEHLVMIGGASDILIESNIGIDFATPTAQHHLGEQPVHYDEQVENDESEPVEFDDIFSPTETAELTKETPATSPESSSWRDKAATATVLATAGLSTEQSDHQDDNSQSMAGDDGEIPNLDTSASDADAAFSGLTGVLDAELAKNSELGGEQSDASPLPSSSAGIASQNDELSENESNQPRPSAPPNKQDMEDEMQRLLNELTGEKS